MVFLLGLTALVVILLTIRAARQSSHACRALTQASLPGELVSIDTPLSDLGELRQENIVSARYGISGQPDRIVKTATGIIPPSRAEATVRPPGAGLADSARVAERRYAERLLALQS
jgi:hypothetical protein